MYTILKTGMGPFSGNVGDQLVLESAKQLITHETGIDSFRVYYRETDLTSVLDKINDTAAVIMPSFEIRGDIVPHYRFSDNISDIEVPLIPMGAGWKSFPGDSLDVRHIQYSSKAKSYLSHINDQVESFTTRDLYTSLALERNGITETELVGDCAWYNIDKIGEPMARPDSIEKLVFTTPHQTLYRTQAEEVLRMLRDEFPDAKLFCSLHNTPSDQDRELAAVADKLDYEVVRASLDTDNIAFYSDCDLHVGYRLHGHIAFLRERQPSVLINEDGRGAGLTHTVGVGGFNGFRRRLSPTSADLVRAVSNVKYVRWMHVLFNTTLSADEWRHRLIAPADESIPETVRSFVQSELETRFNSYQGVGEFIDRTYRDRMKPFLNSLPR